jgi:hypothetical protein
MNTFMKAFILVTLLLLEGCYAHSRAGVAYVDAPRPVIVRTVRPAVVYAPRPAIVYTPRPRVFLAPRPQAYFGRGWMGYRNYGGGEMREHHWGRH